MIRNTSPYRWWFLALFAMGFFHSVHGQLIVEWSKTFDPGVAKSLLPTGSGGFMFCLNDAVIITDADGDELSRKTFSGTLNSIEKTADGGYLLCGYAPGPYDYADALLIKTDAALDPEWENVYRRRDEGGWDEATHARQTADGGFVMCCLTSYFIDFPYHDDWAWIVKIDAYGMVAWSTTTGSSGGYGDKPVHIEQSADGGLMTFGSDLDGGQAWLDKSNPGGGETWTKNFRFDSYTVDEGYFFYPVDETGFIHCGTTSASWGEDSDAWLFKTDIHGDQLWGRRYGDEATDDIAYCVKPTADQGYIVCGQKQGGASDKEAWVFKTDVHGNMMWQQAFGSSVDDLAISVLELSAGEYVLSGQRGSSGWLFKVSGSGELLPPVLVDPVVDKIGIGVNCWFNWLPCENAVSYKLQIDDNINFTNPKFSEDNITETRFLVTGLDYNSQYYWRIRARDAANVMLWSEVRGFKTMSESAVTIDSPTYYVLGYLEEGDQYYIDRNFIIHSIPKEVKNFLWIKTANADKNNSSANYLTFQLDVPAVIYIGYDSRATDLPIWLSNDFTPTGDSLRVSDLSNSLALYENAFAPGTVTLGGNMASGAVGAKSDYVVLIGLLPSLFVDNKAGLNHVQKSAVAWGDYDRDGDLDLFLSGQDNSDARVAEVYRNDNGNFTNIHVGFTGVRGGSAVWGDCDNDGDLDIVYCGQTASGETITRLYLYNSGDQFEELASGIYGVTSGSLAWGDYNNDGVLDLLLTGRDTDGVIVTKVYKNSPAGTFTEKVTGMRTLKSGCGDWCDYDLDGDLDILLSGQDTDGVYFSIIYRNDGNGVFTDIGANLEDVTLSCGAWGDYDNDGDPDVLLAGWNGVEKITRIYRNNGDETWTDIGAGLPGVSLGSVAWGDRDNDGDLDILLTGEDNAVQRITAIYDNTGDGHFVPFDANITGIYTGQGVWGDFDNDGDLDVLLSGLDPEDHNVAAIYTNHIQGKNTIPQPPGDLNFAISDTSVTLNWSPGQDAETSLAGLSYNVRISTVPGGGNLLSSMSLEDSGLRQVVRVGNAGQNTQLILTDLTEGMYYWSVQTVDHCYAGSRFATEGSFYFTPVPVEIASFYATAEEDRIDLIWETASEAVNLGFNIYRQAPGQERFARINPQILRGAGTSSAANRYKYSDFEIAEGGTYHYKLEQIDLDGTATFFGPLSVKVNRTIVPTRFALEQNYPNPFNPDTRIRYQLAQATDVRLSIFNVKGERVKILLDEHRAAGSYEVVWQGVTDSGMRAPSGIYIARLETPYFVSSKKMVLSK